MTPSSPHTPIAPAPRRRRGVLRPGARRGVALLIVTVSIALLTIMGTQFAYDSRVQFEMAVNARDEVRAYYLARSGVGLSRLLLSFQKQVNQIQLPPGLGAMLGMGGGAAGPGGAQGQNQTLNIQLWKMARVDCHLLKGLVPDTGADAPSGRATPTRLENSFDTEFPGVAEEQAQRNFGTFNGCFLADLADEEQKINVQRLNALGGGDAATVQSLLDLLGDERFEFLFEGEDSNRVRVTPQDVIIAMKDWIDPDENGDALNPQTLLTSPFVQGFGDENAPYQSFEPRYVAKNAPFDSLQELYLVHGVNDRFMAAFGDRLTVFPDVNRNLNINSDDPMLLYAAILTVLDPVSPTGRLSPNLQNPLFVQELIETIRGARMFSFLAMSVQDFITILQASGLTVNPAITNSSSVARLVSDTSETFSIRSVGESGNVTKTLTAVVRNGAQDGTFGRLVYWREE